MSRKTNFDAEQTITLTPSSKKKAMLKKLVWQYLFENKSKAFSVKQLKNALDNPPEQIFDRKCIYDVLYELEEEPIKNHKVYKDGAYFRVFNKDDREKYLAELNKEKSFEEILNEKIETLDFQNIWTEKEASIVPASHVYFYPMTNEKRYFKEVTRILNELFSTYIIAILEGKYNDKYGIYIILKKHIKIGEVLPHIQRLYRESSRQKK